MHVSLADPPRNTVHVITSIAATWLVTFTSLARKFTFTSIATTARRATTVNDRHRVNGPFHGSIPSFLAQRTSAAKPHYHRLLHS